jgi:hypothetical protein
MLPKNASKENRMKTKLPLIIAASAFLAVTPTMVSAQATGDGTASTARDDENHIPWGLFGLLGLAGLIPRKREVYGDKRTTR